MIIAERTDWKNVFIYQDFYTIIQHISRMTGRYHHKSTTIIYPGGEIFINERKIQKLLNLEQALIQSRQSELIESGYFLSEIRKSRVYFYFLETGLRPARDGSTYIVEQAEEIGFIQYCQYCRERLKMSKTDVYRRIRIHENLYENYTHVFQKWLREDGVLPDIKRLDFLALRERWTHPEAERLLESAKRLDAREWEAEKAELLEGLNEEAAQEKAEKLVLHRLQKARAQSATGGTRWQSKFFRRWVATQPCAVTGKSKFGEVHPAHIKSRGSGADDFLNIVPLHHSVHRLQHDKGWGAVFEQFGLSEEILWTKAGEILIGWLIECDSQLRHLSELERRFEKVQEKEVSS